nr:D-alanine--D-alanine ligase [Kofleriaceae bacterium]
TDYDAELTAGTGNDISAVLASCRSIAEGLRAIGFAVDMVGIHGLDIVDIVPKLAADNTELVFNLCESMAGDSRNEPTIVGMMELFGIRYTGSDALALGSCLHKPRAKDILIGRGVATPPHRVFHSIAELDDVAIEGFDYPWFLKLAHEDASVGIIAENLVKSPADLRARAAAMIEEFKQPVLAERYIDGREINVTLLGNVQGGLDMLPLHEIDFSSMPDSRPKIVSYAAKWDETHVDYVGTKPVPLRAATPEFVAAVERTAKAAWHAMGLRDYGRVDLRVDRNNVPWVIDINPNCDISPDAGVARSAAAAGISFPQLMERIVLAASARPLRAG